MEPDENVQITGADKKMQRIQQSEEMDSKYGYIPHRSTNEKIGWLINFQPVIDSIYIVSD
jgi:hypothetical protein